MSTMRECVSGLSKNKNVEKLLPEYISQSMRIHDNYARLKLMMEYFMFYETVSEGINPYIDSAQDIAQSLHQVISTFFSEEDAALDGRDSGSGQSQKDSSLKKRSLEEYREMAEVLNGLRREVTQKMDVLAAYVDRFVIYEYVLNRVQYRFEDLEVMPEDNVFIQDVLNFIFSTRDNVTINDNIRVVLGQLPMRMARSRYFDLIRDSISIYKGSDISIMEGFLYMFRTNAMLYKTPDMDTCFTEFIPVLEELAALDYQKMDGDTYTIYAEKMRTSTSKLNDISDLYMQLQQLINEVYSLVLAAPFLEESGDCTAANTVIRGVNDLFLHRESGLWKGAGDQDVQSDEEKLYWLGEHFPAIEGQQEKLYEAMNLADAILQETVEAQKETIERLGQKEAFDVLGKLQQLASNSSFVLLEEQEEKGKVSAQQADEAASKLISELKTAFKGHSRMVRRAIMANTLEKMPVFFNTPQEVADYVGQSLSLCEDEAEKYASKQLILDLIGNR